VVLQQLSGAYLLLLSLAACCSCEYSIDVVSQLLLGQEQGSQLELQKNGVSQRHDKQYGKTMENHHF
jgi:hypothetical protein